MSHSILSLHSDRFDTRVCFGGCLININGETYDCEVITDKDRENITSPTYTVVEKGSNRTLCTFRPYHLDDGPYYYQINGVSQSGGNATLIVPDHGMLVNDDLDNDDDEFLGYDEVDMQLDDDIRP